MGRVYVCIPMPRGCNLAHREIVHIITTSPLPMEKKDVTIFLVYLFYIFFGLFISRPLLVVLHVGCFILLWCETFVFASPFCNEVVWSLK